jgi:hypothetical protein
VWRSPKVLRTMTPSSRARQPTGKRTGIKNQSSE